MTVSYILNIDKSPSKIRSLNVRSRLKSGQAATEADQGTNAGTAKNITV